MDPWVVLAVIIGLVILAVAVAARRRQPRRPAQRPGEPIDEKRERRVSQLTNELVKIANGREFLRADGSTDPRTVRIGAELNRMDGMQLMLDVHDHVAAECGRMSARLLERAWDGIGDWRG